MILEHDYPNSNYKEGDIFTDTGDGFTFGSNRGTSVRHPLKFHRNFRELMWFEHRKIEDMPKFLKTDQGEIIEIESYDLELNLAVPINNGYKRHLKHLRPLKPGTEFADKS